MSITYAQINKRFGHLVEAIQGPPPEGEKWERRPGESLKGGIRELIEYSGQVIRCRTAHHYVEHGLTLRFARKENVQGQRPECEQREHPGRCTVRFGRPV